MRKKEVLEKAMALAALQDGKSPAEEYEPERYALIANLWTEYIRAGIPDNLLDILDDTDGSAAVITPADVVLMQALAVIADTKA